mgnify:CR=1 FL=1
MQWRHLTVYVSYTIPWRLFADFFILVLIYLEIQVRNVRDVPGKYLVKKEICFFFWMSNMNNGLC